MKIDMPVPTEQQLARSHRCMQIITDAIEKAQGAISFEHYMQLCLYSDEVGYYESAQDIFGTDGDFTTSPERSDYFAQAFAAQIKQLQNELSDFSIVEVGAGSGKFAATLIAQLQQLDCLPKRYLIVEQSAALRARQQQALQSYRDCCQLEWRQVADEPIENAIVIANEVLDALPVKLFAIRNNIINERCVGVDANGALEFVDRPAESALAEQLRVRIPTQVLEQDEQTYCTEINAQIDNFIQQIAAFVSKGIFFYIDYGYPRSEYYHPQRHMGTLICHFKHAANEQPLLWPGLQDISCNVDFTTLAEAADKAGLHVESYATQAQFLLASLCLQGTTLQDSEASLDQQAELKRLLLPGEMGERFQVMVLTKNINLSQQQFATRDLLHRL